MLFFRIRVEWKGRRPEQRKKRIQTFNNSWSQLDKTEPNTTQIAWHTLSKSKRSQQTRIAPLDQCREAPTSSSTQRPQDECDQTSRKTRRAGSNQRTTPGIPPQQEHYTHPRMKNRRQLQRMNADALFLFTSNYATTNHTVSALDRETSSTSRTLRFNPPSKLHLLHASRKT